MWLYVIEHRLPVADSMTWDVTVVICSGAYWTHFFSFLRLLSRTYVCTYAGRVSMKNVPNAPNVSLFSSYYLLNDVILLNII